MAQVKSNSSRSRIYRPASYVERIDLGPLFPTNRPLEVELGAGDGSFLVRWAELHPERNFLGIERLLGRLRKIDRKAGRLGLENVRLMRIEAGYFVEFMLPPRSISALHIYFPDPWPKRKQRKNRLINGHFIEAAAMALLPGGRIYLRTDDPDYFAQMRLVFKEMKSLREIQTPAELQDLLTDFERGFRNKGIDTLRAGYEKC